MVSLPTPLRRVHPVFKKGGSRHKFIARPSGIDKGGGGLHVEKETLLCGVFGATSRTSARAPKIDWARGTSDERPIDRGSSLEPDGAAHDTVRRCGVPSTGTEFRSFRTCRFP